VPRKITYRGAVGAIQLRPCGLPVGCSSLVERRSPTRRVFPPTPFREAAHHNLWCTCLIPHLEISAQNFPKSRYAGLRGFIRLYAGGGRFSTRINPPNHSRKVAYLNFRAAYCRVFCEAALSGTPQPVVYLQTNTTSRQTGFFAPFPRGEKILSGPKRSQAVPGEGMRFGEWRPGTLRQQLQCGRKQGHHKDLLDANQQVDCGRCSVRYLGDKSPPKRMSTGEKHLHGDRPEYLSACNRLTRFRPPAQP
jgi:hypothetical protein